MNSDLLPEVWAKYLTGTVAPDILPQILDNITAAREQETVYPPQGKIFSAFDLTPPHKVKVVIIGQDPYHNPDEAQGLAFSVPDWVKIPPSLRNIRKELLSDLGIDETGNGGDLTHWAVNGILLLNSVLTVAKNAPGSHRKFNWEVFTDAVVKTLSEKETGLVFILWGNFAISKKALIAPDRGHLVIESPHPSPLSASRGFFGSKPFSRAEKHLHPWHWPDNSSAKKTLF